MAEYKKQAEGQPDSTSDPKPPSSASSPMGMMQLPGRRGKGSKYPGLNLVTGGVSDGTYEATVLGELAVITVDPPEVGN